MTHSMGSKEETSDSSAGFSGDRQAQRDRQRKRRRGKNRDKPDRQKRG